MTDTHSLVIRNDLKVGFARVAYTDSGLAMHVRPERPTTFTVHDDLCARAMVVQGAEGAFCLLSLDHSCLEQSRFAIARERIAQATGIDPRRIATFCSHTHSDFDDWNEDLFYRRLTEAAEQALGNVQPASAAYVACDVGPGVNVNRRVFLPGLGAFCIMYNTGCRFEGDRLNCTGNVRQQCEGMGIAWEKTGVGDRQLYADNPADRALNAIVLRGRDGKTLGCFSRFSAHACVVGPRHEHIGNTISADYVGYLARRAEEQLGGVCLFGNGPCGNIRILYRENTFREAERIGTLLADRLIREARQAAYQPLAEAEARHVAVSLPIRGDFPKTAADSQRQWDAVKAEAAREEAGGKDPIQLRRLADRSSYLHTKTRLLRGGARNPAFLNECLSGSLTRDLNFFRLNDAGLVTLPGEVFTQIGQRIVDRAGKDKLFVVSLANGFMPYLPCGDEYDTGAYEVKESVLEAGADEQLVRHALDLCR